MIKKAIIFLLVLFLSFSVSAQNITLSYPPEVEINQEFSLMVLLSDFDSVSYDIKIDVLDSSETRVAKILNNGEWKSTYYYINDAISNEEQKEFQLKIENYVGISDISVKLRVSGTSTIAGTFGGYTIESLQAETSQETNSTTDEGPTIEEPETSTENNPADEPEQEGEQDTPSSNPQDSSQEIEEIKEVKKSVTSEMIYLMPASPESKDIKTNNNVLTSDNFAIFGLAAFGILLGVLLTVKRMKKPKTEFKEEFKTI